MADKEVAKMGIGEMKQQMGLLMDAVQNMASEFDSKQLMAEIKDLEMSEYMELAMVVLMRMPSMIAAFKKDPS